MLGRTPPAGDGLPAVARMYNLYHPFDPVGFRCAPVGSQQPHRTIAFVSCVLTSDEATLR